MEVSLAGATTHQGGALIAAALVALLFLWWLAKQLRPAELLLVRFPWSGAVIDFALLPVAAYGTGVLLEWVMGRLGLADWQKRVHDIAELLIFLAVAWGVGRLLEVWMLSKASGAGRPKLSHLGRTAIYAVCFVVAVFAFLIANGYAPTELYVSTGALAALVAFAMQQTLGDLFSGIALSIEKPFGIGDWLRFNDGTEGEVVDVNWRSTRLRGWDNTTLVVPNGQLAKQNFTNLHGPTHYFAPWYFVRVSGDADPRQVKALLEEAALRCDSVLRDPAPVARLTDGTTIPYTYMVWVHFPNYPAMFVGREDLYREIHYALGEAGLNSAAEIHEVRHRPVDLADSEGGDGHRGLVHDRPDG